MTNRYILFGLIILLLAGGSYWYSRDRLSMRGKRQAIFLENGQVYFGKIKSKTPEYIELADIYYLQSNTPLQVGNNGERKKFSIVKLGDELHGPEDTMFINREKILFYENMKSDSKVNDAIKRYLESKATASPSPSESPTESASPQPSPSPSA